MIEQLRKMAMKSRLGWPMMRERMAESCHRILKELGDVQARTRKFNEAMVKLLHETIGDRATKMLKALSMSQGI